MNIMKRFTYILIVSTFFVLLGCQDNTSPNSNSPETHITDNEEQIDVTLVITVPDEIETFESIEPIQMTAESGDTIIDVTKNSNLTIDVNGSGEDAYMEGINGLYALDEGAASGWLVKVNDEFIEIGAGSYVVEADDEIEWLYTNDFNKEFE